MTDRTITIPANLWGGRQPRLLRRCADELEQSLGRNPAVADLIDLARRLADEIEKQTPREPGWYSVRADSVHYGRRFLYYWDGSRWLHIENGEPAPDAENFGVNGPGAIIEPVTIGGAS